VAKRKVSRKYKQKAMMERQMTKERKMPAQKPKQKFNFWNFLKNLPKKVAKFFRNVVHELKRVTWPNRRALLTYTVVVLVTIAIFGVILGLYDFIFLQLVELLVKI
ncbi:MAG: preprotein translocase subunit SecE, partial [Actinobacteria bacterium]|nr:preprotein translocase subunit SecE [Actinomycetota bacterium]